MPGGVNDNATILNYQMLSCVIAVVSQVFSLKEVHDLLSTTYY